MLLLAGPLQLLMSKNEIFVLSLQFRVEVSLDLHVPNLWMRFLWDVAEVP